MQGIRQSWDPIRQAAHLIHSSLIQKRDRVDPAEWMPLPFDEDPEVLKAERMKARQAEYFKLKQQLLDKTNGN